MFNKLKDAFSNKLDFEKEIAETRIVLKGHADSIIRQRFLVDNINPIPDELRKELVGLIECASEFYSQGQALLAQAHAIKDDLESLAKILDIVLAFTNEMGMHMDQGEKILVSHLEQGAEVNIMRGPRCSHSHPWKEAGNGV